MVSSEHIVREIPEDPDNPYRLGRKINHDPRSARFAHIRRAVPVVTRDRWPRGIPILDQANLGSCVPNTGVAVCSTASVDVLEPREYIRWADRTDELTESLAVEWYRQVTRADPFTGAWEPDDTGSDGTSMAQLLLQWGLVVEYRHAFGGVPDVLDALMTGVVMMGSNFYSSMFRPTSDGFVVITSGAYVAGGHEYTLNGRVDVEDRWVEWDNSWGPDWGDGGRARLSFDTLERLLAEDGDATVLKFVPTLVVPPEPVEPEPVPVDPVEPSPVEPSGCLPASKLARRLWGRA